MYKFSDFWVMRSKALRIAAVATRHQRAFQRKLRDAQNNANQDDANDDDDDGNNDDDDSNSKDKQRGDPDEAARRKRAQDDIHKE
jgi:hypothetical protein